MFERLGDTNLLIGVALATLGAPIVFLAVLAVAARRRASGTEIGARLEAAVALTGGLSMGTLLLVGGDLLVSAPIIAVATWLVVSRWRARRRTQAGWLAAGIGLPIAIAWGAVLAGPPSSLAGEELLAPAAWVAIGGLLTIGGLAVAMRGDPARNTTDAAAPVGQPGSRAFGNVAEAIRAAARVGPFGVPEIAMLVAIVLTAFVIGLLLPTDTPRLLRFAIEAAAIALVGTEAYVRAWTGASRRAFEAFSWLGESELAHARQVTGRGVPTTKGGAEAWLRDRPESPEDLPIRIELLLFVDRIDEARRLLSALSVASPGEAFEAAALADLVDWRAGGPGDIPAMEAAAAQIFPVDGDDRLRAEVSIATSTVRRRMAEGAGSPAEVLQPLLEVRERLGRRADGQVGRALRPRILPVLLVAAALLMLAGEVLGGVQL